MMTPHNERLRSQVIEIGRWALCLPALAFWPFLSAMPAFSLAGEDSLQVIVPNLLFLVTGFWGTLGACVIYKLITGRMMAAGYAVTRRSLGLWLGAQATLWTVAYGLYKLL
jgi:hypothetical protein